METTEEKIDGLIIAAETRRDSLLHQFATISGMLREVENEIGELANQKIAFSQVDFTKDKEAFTELCVSAQKVPLARRKMEEVIRSFPLPAGVTLETIKVKPGEKQPCLTLSFKEDTKFSEEDATLILNLVKFIDVSDYLHSYAPVDILEYTLNEDGVYTLEFDRDDETAHLHRAFFAAKTIEAEGPVAVVLEEVAAYQYYLQDKEKPVDWDYEEER